MANNMCPKDFVLACTAIPKYGTLYWEGEWHRTIDTESLVEPVITSFATAGVELPPNFKDDFLRAFHESADLADKPFWGTNNRPQMIDNPDDVIFVVSLLENDDGNPSNARSIVKGIAVSSLASSMDMLRQERVDRLLKDIEGAVGTITGFPSTDERMGPPREIKIYQKDLDDLGGAYQAITKKLLFQGNGGRYRLYFSIKRH